MRLWATLLVIAAAAETIAIIRSKDGKDAGTLSYATRRVFRTDTRLGRWAFILTLGGASAWTAGHILEGQRDARPPAT